MPRRFHHASGVALAAAAGALSLASPKVCFAAPAVVERIDSQVIVEAWRTPDGLPHNSIGSIAQTPEGYLWLATQVGLVRFDGVRFTLFDSTSSASLVRKHIQTLHVGRDGALWVGTFGGGVVRWRLGSGLERFLVPGLPADLVVEAIYEDRAGVLWVGSQGRGLFRVEGGSVSVLTVNDGLTSNTVAALCGDVDGGLWISPQDTITSSSGQLMRLADGAITVPSSRDGLPASAIQSLFETRSGEVYVATDDGLARWNGESAFEVLTAADGLPSSRTWSLTEDRDGTLWVATERGLARLDGQRVGTVDGADFASPGIPLFACGDREGSVWIGTFDRGLVRVRPARTATLGRRDGLAHDLVWAVQQARDGALWVGTDGGATRIARSVTKTYTTADGLPHDTVRSIAEDREGGIWLGTQGGGVCRLHNDAVEVFSRRDGLPDDVVYATFEDRHGVVWVGTAGGLVALGDHGITVLTERDGLSDEVVRAIIEDRSGRLLVGTNRGLDVVEGGRARPLASELAGDFVLSLHEDADGVLWIGTNGGGLVGVREGRVFRFDASQGMSLDVVYKVVEGADGYMWLSSNTGIARVAKAELLACLAGETDRVTLLKLDARDGMRTAECNGGSQSSGCLARDGSVWFPTMRGVAIIRASSLAADSSPPPVLIESLTVNGHSFDINSAVIVPPGRGDMEVDFTALSLLVPSRVRFRYRIEGFDHEWVEAGTRRAAYYTNLPPGRHVFRVVACNGDGVWNTTGASVDIMLEPHFYETTWFVLACGFALASGGWLTYRFRVRQLRERTAELQARVDAAMAEIKVLGGLLSICSSCKKIRDDDGAWRHLETFIREHSQASFSHGLCPDCLERLYPGLGLGR